MTRTSTLVVCESPIRSNSRSCSTRSSFICSAALIVPTSSRKSVPLCACSNRPCLLPMAPVNAPRTWPNSSASSSVSGIALQLTRDEAVHVPRAVLVNRARDHLLAAAGLAGDQNRAVRRRDGFEQLEQPRHRAALADDALLESVPFLELRAQVCVLRSQAPLLERGVEHVQQLVDLKRLADEIARAALDGLDGVFHRAVSRDDDRDDIRIARDGGFDHRRAVDAGQPQVGEDDVEREIGEPSRWRLRRIRPARPDSPGRSAARRWPGAAAASSSTRRRCLDGSVIYEVAKILTQARSCMSRLSVPNLQCSSLRYTISREARAKWNEKQSRS